MDLGLQGKYALITGGSHGIGRSIALCLAEEGCNVAICARKQVWIDQTVAEIRSKNVKVIGICADATNPVEIDKVMQTIHESWGTLHILVNNVGGGGRWGKEKIEDNSDEVWLEVFNKNAMTAVRFTVAAIPG